MLRREIASWLTGAGLLFGAPLRFEDCRILQPGLLHRRVGEDVTLRSLLPLALPYYCGHEEARNLSLYAVSRDYHLCWERVFAGLLPLLQSCFPGNRFFAFADHSPIDERLAAASAGLGVLGDHGLLITERYGSFVFLGEILSDLVPERWTEEGVCPPPAELRGCLHCGACKAVCPMEAEGLCGCLSELTQKKGALLPETVRSMRRHQTAWGCDLCQLHCPMNAAAAHTPVAFFAQDRIPFLSAAQLAAMGEDAFRERAYAWRGRTVILRNLQALEQEGEGEC